MDATGAIGGALGCFGQLVVTVGDFVGEFQEGVHCPGCWSRVTIDSIATMSSELTVEHIANRRVKIAIIDVIPV